jgi:hypothetical protein
MQEATKGKRGKRDAQTSGQTNKREVIHLQKHKKGDIKSKSNLAHRLSQMAPK